MHLLAIAVAIAGCRPALAPPRESLRITGTVVDNTAPPTSTPTLTATPTSTETPAPSAAPAPADPSLVAPSAAAASALSTPGAPVGATPAATRTPRHAPIVRALPVGVVAYERCSPELFVLRKCPGRFLGEAKLAKPGPFIVEVDTEAPEITLFAFRGFLGQEEACAEVTVPVAAALKPMILELRNGECSAKLTRPY